MDGISKAVSGKTRLDEETLENIEEQLIAADMGVETSLDLIETVREKINFGDRQDASAVLECLRDELMRRLEKTGGNGRKRPEAQAPAPHVILVTGVNGVGKTTTIGKLANRFVRDGKKVVLGAADTFRAAASEQLEIWAERSGVEIVRNRPAADPAAVAFDTVTAACNRGADLVLIDTAGRLHNKSNLMEELRKIHRTIGRKLPGAPHEVLLVLDATTGQNGLAQARIFKEAVSVTGIVLTKLDGTAKGGIVVAIQDQLGIPIRYVGVGEGIDDLQPFSARAYVEALFA